MHMHHLRTNEMADGTNKLSETVHPALVLHASGWWHELNCRDVTAAIAFYGKVLGWRFQRMPATDETGGRQASYHVALSNNRPVCGLFRIIPQEHGDLPDHWLTYMRIRDMDATLRALRLAGGSILRPPLRVPWLGRLALATDNGGAIIGLLQPDDSLPTQACNATRRTSGASDQERSLQKETDRHST